MGKKDNKRETINKLRAAIEDIQGRPSPVSGITNAPDEIDSVLPGEHVSTPYGECYLVKSEYDLGAFHGSTRIREIFDTTTGAISDLVDDPDIAGLNHESALYFDTETTGLSAVQGAFAFMIGCGFFSKDKFEVRQIFARDYVEEPASLYLFSKLLKNATHIVSFNGKAFDAPLLDTRLAMAKFDYRVSDWRHIDLLTPARRIWRYSGHGCSLGALEEFFLDFVRHGDVPGFEIPALYAEYLRTRDARKLIKVFTHNSHDIVSMVTLQTRIAKILTGKNETPLSPEEQYALGKIYLSSGQMDRALLYIETSIEGLSDEHRLSALRELGRIYWKGKQPAKAAECHQAMVDMKPESLYPYQKLAIHLENREKDYKRALEIIETGLRNVVFTTYEKKKAWEHRKKRVERKLEKEKNL